uniref:Uncharacterized protein n=1 Tax=Chromera velia CCMP2878 TaxID=1169474 RepID=A0A0G4F5G6_9ALVE|eukprot:Cvel_15141.t1-p1 / transcript=Cvel_15141.t1 / gene=Cvel_15141 / organism=Chromera_velia_CCMP2878 / gene_product=hypothetical protein / transcript_product=hypothetical protein / location=Cvel_scaffold1105:19963-23001(+) / protein_length=717 / sequence_SO=supercontig / SO=protein_coding / is_pseudo=false
MLGKKRGSRGVCAPETFTPVVRGRKNQNMTPQQSPTTSTHPNVRRKSPRLGKHQQAQSSHSSQHSSGQKKDKETDKKGPNPFFRLSPESPIVCKGLLPFIGNQRVFILRHVSENMKKWARAVEADFNTCYLTVTESLPLLHWCLSLPRKPDAEKLVFAAYCSGVSEVIEALQEREDFQIHKGKMELKRISPKYSNASVKKCFLWLSALCGAAAGGQAETFRLLYHQKKWNPQSSDGDLRLWLRVFQTAVQAANPEVLDTLFTSDSKGSPLTLSPLHRLVWWGDMLNSPPDFWETELIYKRKETANDTFIVRALHGDFKGTVEDLFKQGGGRGPQTLSAYLVRDAISAALAGGRMETAEALLSWAKEQARKMDEETDGSGGAMGGSETDGTVTEVGSLAQSDNGQTGGGSGSESGDDWMTTVRSSGASPIPQRGFPTQVAAEFGRLDCLVWLRSAEPQPFQWGPSVCERAAANGHLDVLQWLRGQSPPCPWTAATVEAAAGKGFVDVVQWATTDASPSLSASSLSVTMAAEGGHLEVLKVLKRVRGQDVKPPKEAVKKALEGSHWSSANFLLRWGGSSLREALENSGEIGNLVASLAKWAQRPPVQFPFRHSADGPLEGLQLGGVIPGENLCRTFEGWKEAGERRLKGLVFVDKWLVLRGSRPSVTQSIKRADVEALTQGLTKRGEKRFSSMLCRWQQSIAPPSSASSSSRGGGKGGN